MRQIFFILNNRSGTNLWKFLSGQHTTEFAPSKGTVETINNRTLTNPDTPITTSKDFWFLPTIPKKICPCDVILNRPTRHTNLEYHAWWMPHGDWWGDATGSTVPGPYDVPCETRYGPDELRKYDGDWKFVYMIRDGRNQIESLLRFSGGFELRRFKEDPIDYFQVVCKAWRNRARMALDCKEQMDSFRLVYFEEFVKDPVGTMCDMLEFSGLEPDRLFIERANQLMQKRNTVKQHSSFGTLKGLNQRWESWEEWQKETFHEIAGQELEELGYR